jgi:transcription elongation GreA/GreB family factor
MTQSLKQSLFDGCLHYTNDRIDTARSAMESAQESANSESKSSAGDKYETGRAMAQIERTRHAVQLADAQAMQQELLRIDPQRTCTVGQPGAMITTTTGQFFISIGAGKLTADGQTWFAVSPTSPVGQAMRGRQVGDTVLVNGNTMTIKEIG